MSLGDQLLGGLTRVWETTLLAPFDPAQRLYWGFIFSSGLMALLAVYLQRHSLSSRTFLKIFVSKRYWLNRSSLTDIGYFFGNGLLKTLVIAPLLGSHLIVGIAVARFFQATFDTPAHFSISPLAVTTLFTITFFIVEDFSRFILHLSMHKFSFLWYFHKVHHSAQTLTPLTLYRIHPIEMIVYYGRGLLVTGFLSGFFVYLFGAKVSAFDILGVHALGFVFNALGANLRHSHIWLGFGALEHIFISPAQHQIHHSSAPEHRNKNFGTCLSLWDSLFRSLVFSGKFKRLRFGLTSS